MPRSPQAARRGAFTLVELLVVIGIIALLISILLPALNRARASANTVKCLANLRSIGQSINIYATYYKGSLPYGFWDGVGSPDGTNAGSTDKSSDFATLLLGTVMGSKSSGGTTYGDIVSTNGSKTQQMFACPSAIDFVSPNGRVLHYGCHPRLMPDLDQVDTASTLPAGKQPLLIPYKTSQIRQSAEIALVWDALQLLAPGNDGNALAVQNGVDSDGLYRGDASNGKTWNFLLSSNRTDGTAVNLDNAVYTSNKDWTGTPPAPGYYPAFAFADIRWRHGKNDTANFVFADGHADTRRLKVGKDAEFRLRNLYVNPINLHGR